MKRYLKRLHLWLSVPLGVFVTVICWSGAVLIFETELLQLCYPSRYFVKEVKDERLTLEQLVLSARKQLPDTIKINGIRFFQDSQRTCQLILPGKKVVAFIDPYTGKITGYDDENGFFMKTMRLHRWLLDEFRHDGNIPWGKMIVGYTTLLFVIILISGMIIWYPRNRNILKLRLKVKINAGWKRFWYDLHLAGGFYTALLLLLMALTGLTWSFTWYRNSFYSLFGAEVENHSGKHAVVADGKKKIPDYTLWDRALAVVQSRYSSYEWITIQNGVVSVSTSSWGNTRAADKYHFDISTGKLTSVQLHEDLPQTGKIRGWIYSVHVGSWGGLIGKILWFCASVVGGILPLTGYYLWICRTFASGFKDKKVK